MHNIKYSNQAEIDLENAISYIAKDSKQNAISYLLRYEEKIELVKLNPNMGPEVASVPRSARLGFPSKLRSTIPKQAE